MRTADVHEGMVQDTLRKRRSANLAFLRIVYREAGVVPDRIGHLPQSLRERSEIRLQILAKLNPLSAQTLPATRLCIREKEILAFKNPVKQEPDPLHDALSRFMIG